MLRLNYQKNYLKFGGEMFLKNSFICLALFLTSLITVTIVNYYYAPLEIANSAVDQVEDSNQSAIEWKQKSLMFKYLYIIPFVLFLLTIFSFIKKK